MTSATVIGGGVAGLVAARHLARKGVIVDVFEAADQVGGKIETVDIAGRPVDTGADSFVVRVPEAVELCEELGLGEQLVAPAASSAGLWSDGAMRALPAGLVLGVPSRYGPLARSRILSPAGLARALAEPLLPRTRWTDDVGVGTLVRRRFGREVHERLVDALLGGINAGRSEDLSIEVGAPQLAEIARRSRSLVLGLRSHPQVAAGPVFNSLQGGMAQLVHALAADIASHGGRIHTGTPIESLSAVETELIVVATPAFAASRLLTPVSADAATLAANTSYASVTVVTLLFASSALPQPLAGAGFLVPRVEGRLMTACSFGSEKWPEWSRNGDVVLRVSTGRAGDDRAMAMTDDELTQALLAELDLALGLKASPTATSVRRWPAAFPQFLPGHVARTAALQAALAQQAPRVAVAGAWTLGVGIPACIRSGHAAAEAVLRGAATPNRQP